MKPSDLWRLLPSASDLLDSPTLKKALGHVNRSAAVARVQGLLIDLRGELSERLGDARPPSFSEVAERIGRLLRGAEAARVDAVVNATGRFVGGPWVGRPLSDAACERLAAASRDFSTGIGVDAAGHPAVDGEATRLARALSGAGSATLFASYAQAVATLASPGHGAGPLVIARREVFRLDAGPLLTDLAPGRVVEVGAADGATPADYAAHLAPGALIWVRRDGGQGSGAAGIEELASLARDRGATLVVDLHAGALAPVHLPEHRLLAPTAAEALARGAHLVVLRCDGLVGGPACGLLLAAQPHAEGPLASALAAPRGVDVLHGAALAATLAPHAEPERAALEIPLLALLSTPVANLRQRAQRLAPQIEEGALVGAVEVVEGGVLGPAETGLPVEGPTVSLALTPALGGDVSRLDAALRGVAKPVWGRLEGGRLLLDLRTIPPRCDLAVLDALAPESAQEPAPGGALDPPTGGHGPAEGPPERADSPA